MSKLSELATRDYDAIIANRQRRTDTIAKIRPIVYEGSEFPGLEIRLEEKVLGMPEERAISYIVIGPQSVLEAGLIADPGVVPVPMRLFCPACHEIHLDVGEFETKPHHTHACQHCGNVWRPALVPTVGVRFLPGFKNE